MLNTFLIHYDKKQTMSLIIERWKQLKNELKLIYSAYGGIREIFLSPYFQISFAISFLISIFAPIVNDKWEWYNLPVSTLPSIVGFSLAAYAIVLTFGSEKFQKIIRGRDDRNNFSPYIKVSSSLAHFVVMQVLSLFLSVICSYLNLINFFIAWLGVFLYLYSLLL